MSCSIPFLQKKKWRRGLIIVEKIISTKIFIKYLILSINHEFYRFLLFLKCNNFPVNKFHNLLPRSL